MSELSITENLKLFNIYNHYRITVGIVLGLSAFFFASPATQALLGNLHRVLIITYLGVHLFSTAGLGRFEAQSPTYCPVTSARNCVDNRTGRVGRRRLQRTGQFVDRLCCRLQYSPKKNVSLSLCSVCVAGNAGAGRPPLLQNLLAQMIWSKQGVLGMAYFVTAS